jgi:hypothetical protein
MEKVEAVNASHGWSVAPFMRRRRARLLIVGAILALSLLGLTTTPALASTGQEINLLPTLDALNLHEGGEPGYPWHELAWDASTHPTGQETKSGWDPWSNSLINGAYRNDNPYYDISGGDAAALTMQVGPGTAGCYVAASSALDALGNSESVYALGDADVATYSASPVAASSRALYGFLAGARLAWVDS